MTVDSSFSYMIDSHCHLDRYSCAKEVIQRAQEAGVSRLLSISVHRENARCVMEIANAFSCVYASVGVHPCDINQDPLSDLESWLVENSAHPKILGLGETGIDIQSESPKIDLQLQGFEAHVNAALRTSLPLIVHVRNGFDVFFDFWKHWNKEVPKGVLHCFTGTWDQARTALDMGWYISFSGIITFKNNGELEKIVKSIPFNQFLVETDAPWLTPEPYRGRRNEPAYLTHTVKKISELRQCTKSQICQWSTKNFYELFRKIKNF
ncbi:putative deoxyribonuclease YabD [Holospora obtusa F1]|uniref:Deoxyribonuclease YabD n=1 Tax=Holospora obtusa F1 TaxID=1399147 RepID=W6TFE2_HOLOB|nr:TatD family hydrolase [Holospora obtusa]ETZ07731.1 putative deoxyribonuclease YabD [Holospora obtusa F1]